MQHTVALSNTELLEVCTDTSLNIISIRVWVVRLGENVVETHWCLLQRSAVKSFQQLGDSNGSVLMLLVAFLWSITSAFDKMGMAASPTLAAYLAVQRAITAIPCVLYIALKDFRSFRCVPAKLLRLRI
jgi:hypothetical protein